MKNSMFQWPPILPPWLLCYRGGPALCCTTLYLNMTQSPMGASLSHGATDNHSRHMPVGHYFATFFNCSD